MFGTLIRFLPLFDFEEHKSNIKIVIDIDINKTENHNYDTLMAKTNIWISFARYFVDQKWIPKLQEKNKMVPNNIKEKLTFCDHNFGAELLWIQSIQKQNFSELFALLKNPRA